MINFKKKPKGIAFGKKPVPPTKVAYNSEVPNIEEDSITELTALQESFRAKGKAEKEKMDQNTESEHFSCIVFKNRVQRDRFSLLLDITTDDNQYINGDQLIKALELRIQEIELKSPGKFRVNKEIASLSMEL